MNAGVLITMRLSRTQKLLMASLLLLLVMGLSSLKVAAFVTLIPNPSVISQIPANEKATLNNCDSVAPIQSPAFASWISKAGAPTVTSVQVTTGQANVLLQLNFSGAVCSARNEVDKTGTEVASASVTSTPATTGASLPDIAGKPLILPDFNPLQQLGEYKNTAEVFTLAAPPKGFQGTVTYHITVKHEPENHFVVGWNPPNVCVVPP